jgi:hypothetical protein
MSRFTPNSGLHPLPERRQTGLCLRIVRKQGHGDADKRCAIHLLRARCERSCHSQSSNSFNEGASSHRRPKAWDHANRIGDYSRDLQLAEWSLGVSLHGSNLKPPMSALAKADIAVSLANARFTRESGHQTGSRYVRRSTSAASRRCDHPRPFCCALQSSLG